MPDKNPSILLGASVYAVLSLITAFIAMNSGTGGQYASSALCCLIAISVPAITVWHYTSTNQLTIPAGTGAGLGALAIVIGGLVSYAIQKVLQLIGAFPSDDEILDRTRDQLLDQGMDPAQVDQTMEMSQMFTGFVGVLISLAIAAVIGAIAGAVAASIFKKGPVEEV